MKQSFKVLLLLTQVSQIVVRGLISALPINNYSLKIGFYFILFLIFIYLVSNKRSVRVLGFCSSHP